MAIERIPGFCALCRSRCGCVSIVEDGRLVGVEADPAHPTGRNLCVKGRAAPELVYAPDRLLHPMKRTRPRGDADPGWVSIGWELSATGPSEIGARRARVLAQVLKSVYVQEPSLVDRRVGFGTSVTVEEADGRRTSYEIVGPNEVEPARRQISVASPVARALLGKRAGDVVVLRRPRGDIEVTVVSVTVAPEHTER